MLLMVSFFVVFALPVQRAKVDPKKSSNQILFINMLQIWNLRYSRHFFIIKCVGLDPILFAINLNATSSSKVFSTLNYVFLSIVLLTRINKFISFKKNKDILFEPVIKIEVTY